MLTFGPRAAEQLTERFSYGNEHAFRVGHRAACALYIGDEVGPAKWFAADLQSVTAQKAAMKAPSASNAHATK